MTPINTRSTSTLLTSHSLSDCNQERLLRAVLLGYEEEAEERRQLQQMYADLTEDNHHGSINEIENRRSAP